MKNLLPLMRLQYPPPHLSMQLGELLPIRYLRLNYASRHVLPAALMNSLIDLLQQEILSKCYIPETADGYALYVKGR